MADEPAAAPPAAKTRAPSKADQDAEWEASQTTGDADWAARAAATEAEYGTWVATATIKLGGAEAFHVGHSIPQGHIDRYGLDRREGVNGPLAARRGTPEADAALAAAAGA